MPKMGISVSEGTILEWRKQPGDWVEADETIADVTTDKVDVEIPSPATGRLARIVAEAGDTVAVGEPIAEIDSGARAGRGASAGGRGRAGRRPSRRPPRARRTAPGFISPVVRRIADKHGIDLEQVEGTGIGGRIRKKDVLAYVEARRQRQAEAGPGAPHRVAVPARAPVEPVAEAPIVDGDRREPMTPMRKAIARHMVDSRRTRRTARRSSRSTCRGSRRGGPS